MPNSLPPAFAVDRLRFDREPTDRELLAVLGNRPVATSVAVRDEAGVLAADPGRFPLAMASGWVVLVSAAVTVVLWVARGRDGPNGGGGGGGGTGLHSPAFPVAMTIMLWLFVVPTMLGVFAWIHRRIAAEQPYFRADANGVELPRLNLTVPGRRVARIVRVTRWVRDNDSWQRFAVTGVLARDGLGGGFDYYPAVVESGFRLFGETTAARLARRLNTTVREVKATLRESRRLGDAARDEQ